MPIYEYQCPKCGHEFEQLVPSMTAVKRTACPKCGSAGARRKLSVFAAHQGAAPRGGSGPAGPCTRCGQADGPCPLGDM